MTTDTTHSPKERMDCARVAREQILESYLLGKLSDEDRDAFEEHFFECTHCFDEVRTLQAARKELANGRVGGRANRRHRLVRWLPAGLAAGTLPIAVAPAAVVVLVAGAIIWLWSTVSRAPYRMTNPSPSSQMQSAQPPPGPPEATVFSVSAQPSIEQLGRIDPPPYEPGTLRGPLDEATQRFRRGMARYRNADYTKAVEDLRAASKLDPTAAHINFFLGVSQLLSGHDDAAIDSLRGTIALGDSPYLEDAHFYLAKAFLRRKDVDAAKAELNLVIKLRGSRSEQARELVAEVERIIH